MVVLSAVAVHAKLAPHLTLITLPSVPLGPPLRVQHARSGERGKNQRERRHDRGTTQTVLIRRDSK